MVVLLATCERLLPLRMECSFQNKTSGDKHHVNNKKECASMRTPSTEAAGHPERQVPSWWRLAFHHGFFISPLSLHGHPLAGV
mmetsp:Transcript_31636/g.66102  ORF Transcript_31636/g.66102 Transcript_31636/m.66102 type:complete len:83 (-) Transcript_31636:217-465(-)